jgi:hypothetical protein
LQAHSNDNQRGGHVKKQYGCGTLILVLIVVGIIANIVTSRDDESAKADAAKVYAAMTPEQQHREDSLALVRTAAKAKHDRAERMMYEGIARLQESMKDPDSYKTIHAFVGPTNDGSCITYRGKNSFGAYSGNHDAVVSAEGRILTEESDGNAFVRMWNKVCVLRAPPHVPTAEEIQANADAAKRQAAKALVDAKARAIQKGKDDSEYAYEHPRHGPYWTDENGDAKTFADSSCALTATGIDAPRHHYKPRWFPNKEVAEKQGYVFTVCNTEAPQ